MKKIIIYLTILLLALTKVASSQVATIETKTGNVVSGLYSTTQVNVTLTGFLTANSNSIGAISMHIGYDPTIATFTGITNSDPNFSGGGAIIANASGNQINISWAGLPAAEINGVAFKLNFNYTGGSCNLTFNQGCEIANGLATVIQTTYQNGAITQPVISAAATIVSDINSTSSNNGIYGVTNYLPITFSSIPIAASAISLNLSYNPNALQFVGIDAGDLTGAIGNALNGVINIAWSNTTAVNLNTLTNNLKLKFNYLGGTSTVNFTGTNIISNANGVQIPITLNNGNVTQPTTTASVSITTSNPYPAGAIVVPVNFAGYSSKAVGAVSMNIAYNPSKLNFTGVDQGSLSGIVSNANNGIISLSWYNTVGVDNFSDFHLKFNYIGGTDTLKFTGQNQIAGVNGVTIPTTFNNGIVIQNQNTTPVTVNIAGSGATFANNTYSVPVNFTGVTNLSAATMYVSFDNTKLTYTGITNNLSGVVANQDPTTKIVILNWSNTTPITSDCKFLDLKFTLNGTGSCDIPITFTSFNSNAGSLANSTGGIVPANWTNSNLNITPAVPTVGTITQPTCALATGTVILNNLPSTGNWTITPGNITGTGTTLTITGLAAGTYNYKVANAAGCTSSASAVVINAQPATPTAPTVGTITQPTCALATGSVILGGLPSGNWTINPGNTIGSGSSYTMSGITTGTHNYTVTNSTSCVSLASANVVINSQPATPAAPTGSVTQTFCIGATVASLGATGTGIKWYSTLSGVTALVNTATLTTSNYYATQTVGICESTDRLTVAVTVKSLPTTANAGDPQTGSSTCGLTSVTLSANQPTAGTGTGAWSIVTGSDGSFGDPSLNTSSFTGTAGSIYSLRWTISNSPCAASTSDVSIKFNQNPTPSVAGADQTGSATCGLTHVSLTGNSPIVGTGLWSIISGVDGTVNNTALNSSSFNGIAGNAYTLQWTISNSPCGSSSTTTHVTFNQTPSAPTGSPAQAFCSGNNPSVTNLIPNGTGIQWYIAPSGGNALSTGTELTSTVYYASQTVGSCESTSRLLVTVTVNTTPDAPSGSAAQSFNAGSTVNNLVATGLPSATFNWYDASTNGNLHLITDVLTNNSHYFASQSVNGCESSSRLDVLVTLNYKVSGYLYYNNSSNTPLTNCTIYLQTNISGYPLVSSTTTDGIGYYELYAPNGSYRLDANTTKAYGGLQTTDATLITKKVAGVALPSENCLRLQAADVHLGATITANDATLVTRRFGGTKLATWTEPDWIFGDINIPFVALVVGNYKTYLPVFTVTNAIVTQNLWGICSGDVNGSYTNP